MLDYSKYEKNNMVNGGVVAYREETMRLRALFKRDAIEDAGLTGHPKAEKAFDMAWERCRSEGLFRVMEELEDLAELML